MDAIVVFGLLVTIAVIMCVHWILGFLNMIAYLRWLVQNQSKDDIR